MLPFVAFDDSWGRSSGPVVGAGGMVCFVDGSGLRAVDSNGADVAWSPWLPACGDALLGTAPALDAQGNLHVLGWQKLHVLAADGSTAWSYDSAANPTYLSPVVDADGATYVFGSGPKGAPLVLALKRPEAGDAKLRLLWQSAELPPSAHGNLSLGRAAGRDVIFAVTGAQLTALDRVTGELVWAVDFFAPGSLPTPFPQPPAQYGTAPVTPASPAVVGPDGTVYLALNGGSAGSGIVALQPERAGATCKWLHLVTDGYVGGELSPPAVSPEGSVWFWYQPTLDQVAQAPRVAELDATTGSPKGEGPLVLPMSAASGTRLYAQPALGLGGTCHLGTGDGSLYAVRPGPTLAWHQEAPSGSTFAIDRPLAIGDAGTLYAMLGGRDPMVLALGLPVPVITAVRYDGRTLTVAWHGQDLTADSRCQVRLLQNGTVAGAPQTVTGLEFRQSFPDGLGAGGGWQVEVTANGRSSAACDIITEAPELTGCSYDDPQLTVSWSGFPGNARRVLLELTPVDGTGRTRRLDLGPSSPEVVQVFLPRTAEFRATIRAATRISFGPESEAMTVSGHWLPAPTIVALAVPSATADGSRNLAGQVVGTDTPDEYGVAIYAADGLGPGQPLPADFDGWQRSPDLVSVSDGRWAVQAPPGQYFAVALVEPDYAGRPIAPSVPSVALGAVSATRPIAGRLPQLMITQRPFAVGGFLDGAVISLDTMLPAAQATYWVVMTYRPASGGNAGQWCPGSGWAPDLAGYCQVADDGTWSIELPRDQGGAAEAFAAMLVAGPAGASAPPPAFTGYQADVLPPVDYRTVLAVAEADPMQGSVAVTLPPYSDGGIVAGRIEYIAPQTAAVVVLSYSVATGTWTQANPGRCLPAYSGSWATNVTAAADGRSYAVVVVHRRLVEDHPPLSFPSLPSADGHDILAVSQLPAALPRPAPSALVLNLTVSEPIAPQCLKVPDLPLGCPVFSIECWVRAAQPGVVASYGVDGQADGRMCLSIADGGLLSWSLTPQGGGAPVDIASGQLDLMDGSWHHVAAVRSLLGLALYCDGRMVASQRWTAAQNAGRTLRNGGVFYAGTARPFAAPGETPTDLSGAIGEIRVWGRVLEASDILGAMYQRLVPPAPDLLGYWSFDDQSAADRSGAGRNGVLVGSPAFTADAVILVRPGEPYLVTQAMLMEDFAGSPSAGAGPVPITSYRVVIKAHAGDTGIMQPEVQVAVVPPSPASPQPGGTGGAQPAGTDGTIVVQTPEGFRTETATEAVPHTLKADPMGEVAFCLQANPDRLYCPVVKVRADFMGQDEWLVISPDRQLHGRLTTISGGQLEAIARRSGGATVELDPQGAEAVARSVRNFTAIAHEHDLESSHPIVRAQSATADTAVPPAERRYQNGRVTRSPYMQQNNVIAADFTEADGSVARIASAEAMPDREWMITWSKGGQPEFTDDRSRVQAAIAGATRVVHASDPLTVMFCGGVDGEPVSRAAYVAALRASAATDGFSWGEFANDLRKAAALIVTTAKKLIDGAKEIVEHVVIAIRDIADQIKKWVVTTAEQAVNAVKAIFEQIGAKVGDVLDFFKGLFDWDDILLSQRVCQEQLEQVIPRTIAQLEHFRPQILGQFDKWRAKIDNAFDQLDRQLVAAGQSLGGQTLQPARTEAAAAGPADIRSGYLTSMTTTGLTSPTTAAEDDPAATAAMLTSARDLLAFFDSVGPELDDFGAATARSGLGGLLADPDAALSGPLGAFVEIVRSLLGALKKLAEAGLERLKDMADRLLTATCDLLRMLDGMLKARLDIPLITPLYEKVIMRGRGRLTAYSLISLLGAVPFTIAYKLAHGGAAPFTRDTPGRIAHRGVVLDATGAARVPEALRILSVIQGFVMAPAIVLNCGVAIANDIASPSGWPRAGVIFETLTWLTTIPLGSMNLLASSTGDEGIACILDVMLWSLQFIPSVCDTVALTSEGFGKVGRPAIVGVVGVASLGLSIALWVFDARSAGPTDGSPAAAGVANLFSIIPQIAQFAQYIPTPENRKAVLVAFDGLGYVMWGGITFVRAGLATDGYVFNPRRASTKWDAT